MISISFIAALPANNVLPFSPHFSTGSLLSLLTRCNFLTTTTTTTKRNFSFLGSNLVDSIELRFKAGKDPCYISKHCATASARSVLRVHEFVLMWWKIIIDHNRAPLSLHVTVTVWMKATNNLHRDDCKKLICLTFK